MVCLNEMQQFAIVFSPFVVGMLIGMAVMAIGR